ncbi:MAG: alpha/beta fold hydrolase, partial [Chloroflexota bacterium]
ARYYQIVSEAGFDYQAPTCRLISNVTGEVVTAMDATYWRRHMRDMVRFSAGMRQLEAEDCQIMVEIGPQPVLMWLGKQNWQGAKGVSWLPSLWSVRSDWEQMLQSAGEMYTRGVAIDWQAFHGDEPRRRVSLPTYPWQRQRYWIPTSTTSTVSAQAVTSKQRQQLHPLLGIRMDSATFQQNEVQFETHLSATTPAYLTDHRIYDYAILPTTAYLEMVLQAAARVLDEPSSLLIENIAIHQAMILPEDDEKAVQLILKPTTSAGIGWQIFGATDEAWQLHAEGTLRTTEDSIREPIKLSVLQANYTEEIAVSDFYASCEAGNLFYGPTFQLLHKLWVQDEHALGHVVLTESLRHDAATYQLHPALLDACLQVSGALFMGDEQTYLPIGVDRLAVMAQPTHEVWCEAQRRVVNDEIFAIDLQLYNPDGTPVAHIDGLQVKATTQEALAQRPLWYDWLYEVTWEAQPLSSNSDTNSVPKANAPWLIFADDTGMGQRVANVLQTRGERVLLIHMGEAYTELDAQTIEMNPTTADDYQQLLARYPTPAGIVHAWSLNSQSTLEEGLYASCGTVLLLMQTLSTLHKLPPLWLVTQGVVMPTGEPTASTLSQSTIMGMAKAIRLEYKQLACVHVDMDADASLERNAQMLAAELTAVQTEMIEEQVAYHNGKRHVARLTRASTQATTETDTDVVRSDATYLITGGLGALGLLAARLLVELGATRLVLMGRSQPKAEAQKTLDTLTAMGATITIAQADVADGKHVANALNAIDKDYPLRGVIYAAGVLDDGAIMNQRWSRFTTVFAPKVMGAWHLHTLTQDTPLDFFILFSSIAALFGSAGQANHGAANAFLDALAHHRQAQGLPARSINWGAWSEVGQAAGYVAQMDGTGMGVISPTQGIEVLAHLLTQAQTYQQVQVGVTPIDWLRYDENTAFYQKFEQASRPANSQTNSLVEQVAGKDAEIQQQLLTTYIQEQVAHILQHDSIEHIDASHRFRELGMDSLTSMELRNRLQEALDHPLSAGVVFNFPAPDSLAAHIVQDVLSMENESSSDIVEVISPTIESVEPIVIPSQRGRHSLVPVALENAHPTTTPMRTYTLELYGLAIHISEWGDENAPPILCQHGIMDQGETWANVAERLVSAGYRVIAPDLRGHGHSAHVGVGGSYHLRDFVGDMDGILAQLALDNVTLVGHSLGSIVTTLYLAARQHSQPSRVKQLILVEPIMPAVDDGSWVFAQQLDTHLRYLDVTSPRNGNGATSSIHQNGTHRPLLEHTMLEHTMLEHTMMTSITDAAERLRQVNAIPQTAALHMAERLTQRRNGGFIWRWDARLDAHDGVLMAGLTQDAYVKMLGQIAVPVHLVYGTGSGWLNASEKEAIQTALPNTAPVVLAGGHNLHVETATALADVLLQTIEKEKTVEGAENAEIS